MNFRFFLFSIVLAFFTISGCSDSDNDMDMCSRDAWLGMYSGQSECDDGDPAEAVMVEVKEGPSDNSVIVVVDGEESILTIDGCTIEETTFELDFFGSPLVLVYSGTFDGTTINLNVKTTLLGQQVNCVSTISKQ